MGSAGRQGVSRLREMRLADWKEPEIERVDAAAKVSVD